jgi:hypothetical protein
VPTWQEQGPEFKSQHCQMKKEKKAMEAINRAKMDPTEW